MKSIRIWAVIGISAILIAGCGAPASTAPPSGTTANQTAGAEGANGSQSTGNGSSNGTDTSSQPSGTNSNPSKTPLPAQKDLEYTVEGLKETHPAKLFRSSQGYYIYVLEQFKAVAEEPGVDDIMLNANENFVMKISMLPRTASLDNEIEIAKAYLKALGNPVQEDPKEVFTDSFFKEHTMAYLHATDGHSWSKKVLFVQVSGVPFKLVIQTPMEAESIASLLAMVQTIGVFDAR